MNIICNREEIVNAVSNVQKAVSTKSTMPVLEGILLNASKDKLSLCGYNLELGITTEITATVKTEGKIILGAKLFSEIIRKLPDDTIEINVNSNFVTNITSGHSKFSIVGISPSEYPELPKINNPEELKISSQVLKSMIRQTLFAIADNDTKPVHTGTLFTVMDRQINLVSVDGYRLAMRTESINSDSDLRFVVPGKTLYEILRLLPEDDTDTCISVASKHIIFKIGNYCVISRLLEGEFLDYKSAIPPSYKTSVRVKTRQLIESVERVSLLITDRLKSPVRCIFSEEKVKLSCSTTIGKANDEFKAPIDGDFLEIGFNNRYLLDALRNTESDEILLQMNGALSPTKVLPVEGESFLFLVLPVRLKSEID